VAFAALLCAPTSGSAASILGTGDNFALLGGTAVTGSGTAGTIISNGIVGSPASVTGFPPAVTAPILLNYIIGGAVVGQANTDTLTTAYTKLRLLVTPPGNVLSSDLAGMTLAPGIYGTSAGLPNGAIDGVWNLPGGGGVSVLTLDAQGKDNVFWVINIGRSITLPAQAQVRLINPGPNGGRDDGIFWTAGAAITFGALDHVLGNYIAGTFITFGALNTVGTVGGAAGSARAFAQTVVTLDTDVIDAKGAPGGTDLTGGLVYNGSGNIVATQSITFAAILGHTACDAPFTFAAPTASSGLPVTVVVTSGPATVVGNTVTLTGAVGTVVLTASQAGNASFAAATNVVQSFAVVACALTPQTITFAPVADRSLCDGAFTVAPTASSSLTVALAVTSGPATVSGNTVTVTNTGTVTLQATQAGNGTYSSAPPVSRTFVVTACPQSITFGTIPNHTACDAPFTFVFPVATSGLPVTLSVSGPASVSGNTVTLTGAIGTVVITASQPGDSTYAAASDVAVSFVAAACITPPTAQTIAFAAIPNHTSCDAPFTFVAPVATSGLPVTLAVSGPATVSGNTVTLTGALGTVVITASQAGNSTFAAAPSATQSFAVGACCVAPVILNSPMIATATLNVPFTFTILASGSPTSYTAFNLPPGLFLNSRTGVISGTPTRATTTFVTLTAINGTCASPGIYLMIVTSPVACVPPVITNSTLTASGMVGTPFSYTITASGSPTSYAAFNLPAGLVLDPVTGVISGTPTTNDAPLALVVARSVANEAKTSSPKPLWLGPTFVTLTAINGACTSAPVYLVINISPAASSRITAFSARALSGPGDQALILGFAVAGNNKNLLVRGIGPTLASFGLSNVLADPLLTLLGSSGVIATNDDWQINSSGQNQSSLIAATAAQVGTFALPNGSKDSALLATVNNGVYTTSLFRPNGTTGIALTEIYDTDQTLGARLMSASARMNVTPGDGALIAGLVIAGNAPKTVLIRGIGPTLSTFGVTGVLADPQIAVFSGSTQIANNDNWEVGTSTVAQIVNATAQVGEFPLPSGSKDAALLVVLQPGIYTVIVTGVGNTTGVALVEVYDIQ